MIYIIKAPFLWGKTRGITIYPFVFVLDKDDKELIRHEMVHVKQVQREGWFKFYTKYIYFNFKYGYENNPYEIEAINKQEKT